MSSLYEGKDAVRRLKKMKKSLSLGAPPSDQRAAAVSSSRPNESGQFEKQGQFQGTSQPEPTQEYVDYWKAVEKEKNKENRPLDDSAQPPAKRRYVDPQPNAHRVEWDDDSQEAESADLDFEQDRRVPDPTRRRRPPPGPPAKRHRAHSISLDEDEAASRSSQERVEEQLQTQKRREEAKRRAASRERRAVQVEDEGELYEEEDQEEAKIPFSQISIDARVETIKAKMPTARTQRRTPWSAADQERLIDLIVEYGCSWSFIQKRGGFEVDRDQVALKDKARNMKVAFIKLVELIRTSSSILT